MYGKISFFNPVWSDTGDLFVAEDSSGWWNITQIKTDNDNKFNYYFSESMDY